MKFWGTSGSFSPLSVLLFVYFIYLLFFWYLWAFFIQHFCTWVAPFSWRFNIFDLFLFFKVAQGITFNFHLTIFNIIQECHFHLFKCFWSILFGLCVTLVISHIFIFLTGYFC